MALPGVERIEQVLFQAKVIATAYRQRYSYRAKGRIMHANREGQAKRDALVTGLEELLERARKRDADAKP